MDSDPALSSQAILEDMDAMIKQGASLELLFTHFVRAWVAERRADAFSRAEGQARYLDMVGDWNEKFATLSDRVDTIQDKSILFWLEKHPKLGGFLIALTITLLVLAQDVLRPLIAKWLGLPL